MSERKRPSLVKPRLDTPFHIDFSWWSENDQDWRVYLQSLLSEEDQEKFASVLEENDMIDWVSPETGEIKQIDGLQHVLITHTAQQEGFFGEHTALVEAIFRLLLKNGNVPLTINEIGEMLGRDPKPILRTLSGSRIYRGIRPIMD